MVARRRIVPVVLFTVLALAMAGAVRTADRALKTAVSGPDPAAVRRALAVARRGDPRDGVPTLLLVVAPGCEPCRRARHELRFLVRPEDLGVRARFLPSSEAPSSLGVFTTPTYLLVDGEDRLLAVAGGHRPPLALRDWIRRELGFAGATGPGHDEDGSVGPRPGPAAGRRGTRSRRCPTP